MKHLLALLFLALLTVAVLLFLTNPQVLSDLWLWLVGFIGYVVLLFEKGFQAVAGAFRRPATRLPEGVSAATVAVQPAPLAAPVALPSVTHIERQLQNEAGVPLAASTLTVLRYLDDGQTTLGLLFLRNKFFAYTLEDTFRATKVAGETRIPAGLYPLDFNRALTGLTQTYRQTRPWFEYHLEIQGIPGFDQVYIHVGNTHEDTRGCLLIADGVNTASAVKMVQYSRLAFERFYKTISALLNAGETVQIRIVDEDWFERCKLSPA
ncbi:hypothetical protein SAMN05421823_112173 [Catalinimonas alkaloidigena]|uniref:DUF5675 domain-containing protein n=1 Tax=Catalinimonas alkaloidigena TaxID=1075417 RepID=A0A1G9SIA5_9BACT|nr:DUF5675 family protein [Catalinimonas alkaloidigena]SDM35132.1 hypothetical protein SAMN05421823_112173 [Catalinimonas alkaloidigena]